LKFYKEEGDEEGIRIIEEHEEFTTAELIEHINEGNTKEAEIIKHMITKRLGIPDKDHVMYLIDMLNEAFTLFAVELEILEDLKRHRHKSAFGLYTEKPVW